MLNFAFLGGVRSDLALGDPEAIVTKAGERYNNNNELNG